MKYILSSLIFIIFISNSLFSQVSEKEKKANEHYEVFNFTQAIDIYESIKPSKLSTNGLRNLADIYAKRHLYDKSEEKYGLLVKRTDHSKDDYFAYALILLENNKPDEAKLWINKFHDEAAADDRGTNYANNMVFFDRLKEDKGRFSVFTAGQNSDKEDFGPAFYGDKVIFTSSRLSSITFDLRWNWNEEPFLNMYVASKDENYQLEEPKLLSKNNKRLHDGPGVYSGNGEVFFFTRSNYKDKNAKGERKLTIYYQTKNKDGKWSEIIPFPHNNPEYSNGHPSVNNEGTVLYYTSDMPGGYGGTDIYKSEYINGVWSTPLNLGKEINGKGNEMFPFYHPDGILFFSSNSYLGMGGLDIFIAKIEDNNEYSFRENLGYPINSSKDDFSFILNQDQSKGYFASNREGGKGSDDIYTFTNKYPFSFCYQLKGKTIDKQGNLISEATIELYNESNQLVKAITSNKNGTFELCESMEDRIKLKVKKDGYYSSEKEMLLDRNKKKTDNIDLVLEKIPSITLQAFVTDADSKEPLENVDVILIDNLSNSKTSFTTDAKGQLSTPLLNKHLNENISYQFVLKKEGYLSKTVTYNKQLTKEGVYVASLELDFSMSFLKVGDDLATMIDISPIYFDLNKFAIRPDAAAELDKIAAIMNEYPGMHVELGSHTDCRGSKAYNESLSDKRAKSSAEYVRSKISNPSRIYGKGYGENRLVNDCACEGNKKSSCSEELHQANRRTEFRITKLDAKKVKVKANGPQSFDK